ncbi:MAG: 3'(2'),5'-bisphosphate nucleotidase CysQ family protein [Opitutaceae bacterium]
MQLEVETLNILADVAEAAAREAGALIASYSQKEVAVQHKSGSDSLATQVVTEVDELSQAIVLKHLSPTFEAYGLALLTEEREDDGSRLAEDYFWCIDPLDGTLPFTQQKPGYAVSIALIRHDGKPMLGVVFDPVVGTLYRAVAGQGIMRDGRAWEARTMSDDRSQQCLRFYCDCTFETQSNREEMVARMEAFAVQFGFSGLDVVIGGGAVMNACSVLECPPACYFKLPKMKAGGGSIWDFAATACLFQEAGGAVATDFAGGALDLNRMDSTFMNHQGVCFASNSELQAGLAAFFYGAPDRGSRLG